MSGQEIANRSESVIATIRGEDFRRELAAALPDTVTVDKFERVTVTALLENPDLAKADPSSLYRAVIKCASDGLLPDGREAALVIFGGKVSYMSMVGGLRKIAAEYGWTVTAHAVASNDFFEHTEEPPNIHHRPVRPGEERGQLVAAYAVARHKDGRRIQRVLYAEEVEKRRKVARSKNIWDSWTEQMYEKTAARDVVAEIPFEVQTERIVSVLKASEMDGAEATAMMYGRGVLNHATGELASPASAPATEPTGQPSTDPIPSVADGNGELNEGNQGDGQHPASVPLELTDAQEVAAIEASMFKAPGGKYGPDREGGALNLGEIRALGADGEAYLRLMLAKGKEGEYRDAIEAFCLSAMPEDYAEIMGRRGEA